MAPLTALEQERAARVAANNAMLASLGIVEAAAQLQHAAEAPQSDRPKPAPRKRKMYEIEVEVRRSGRINGQAPEMNEEALFAKELGIDRLDLVARPRRRRVGINPDDLGSIRARRIKEVDGEDAEVPRGPFDSGLGVRIQGGRVYDSKYGVTCHWCRQKTLEEHVTCTHPDCGAGRRLPVSFCKLCLKNRHGEEILQAEASGKWVCPRCRGSCGEGCTTCCNCGPCRKAAGLAPTHQIINQARAAGFDNVHDYLVHRATGESVEEIAARKRQAAWGAWLEVPFDAEAAAAAAADSDEETQEEEEADGEPAAAAAMVQLGGAAAAATVPEGAGAALLLLGALRWHTLACAFCAAVKAMAPSKRSRGRPRAPQAAAPQTAAAAAPAAPAAPASKAAAAAKAATALRRSGRSQSKGKAAAAAPAAGKKRAQGKLAAKVTAFFQPMAAAVATGKQQQQQDCVAAERAVAAQVAPKARPATRVGGANRLGLRARK